MYNTINKTGRVGREKGEHPCARKITFEMGPNKHLSLGGIVNDN